MCSPPPCSSSIPAPRSRSARRSGMASTTTSSSPTASPSPTATSRRSRPRCASTSRPTSRSCARTSRRGALERFVREEQDYKVELIEDLVRDQGVETVSLYTNNGFTDLCRGPHTPSTKRVKAFKLLSVAGAYWRGDAEPPDAHPHLRHRLPLQGGPRAVPAAARGGPRPRPPQARPRARAVHVLRARPARCSGCRAARRSSTRST